MPDGREVMLEVVKAALRVHKPDEESIGVKKAGIIVEALIAEAGGYQHIMRIDGRDFIVQHPITERFEGRLFNCPIFQQIRDYCDAHMLEDGEYDVRMVEDRLVVMHRG